MPTRQRCGALRAMDAWHPHQFLSRECDGMARKVALKTNLGAIRPHTKAVFEEIAAKWRVWYAWGIGASGEHKEGRALDFMTLNADQSAYRKSVGDAIAAYLWKHRKRLGVWYVIWNRRIISMTYESSGWRTYSGANPHTDHVHVSFNNKPPTYRGPAEGGSSMRSVADVITVAKREHNRPSQSWRRLCLGFVRYCWGLGPTGTPNATQGWNRSKQKVTSGSTPPKGAPVYWRGPTSDGHVAISDGGGYVWSNDFRRPGKIDRVRISDITRGWGATYLGWTRDYVGTTLPLSGGSGTKPTPPPKVSLPENARYVPFPGDAWFRSVPNHPVVNLMGQRLVAEGCGRYKVGPGNAWGGADHNSYKAWQRKLGYSGNAADGWPGKASWDALKVPNPNFKEPDPLAALKRVSLNTGKDRALPAKKPTYVPIHNGGTSAFQAPSGGRSWWGTVSLTIEGLPVGATCQVRYVEVDPRTEKITKHYPITEVTGTDGATFFSLHENGGHCDSGRRLRVVATVWAEGVKVTSTSTRMFYID